MTPPQTKTAMDCARASAMRGTLSARLMVAKERTPSVKNDVSREQIRLHIQIYESINVGKGEALTQRSDNLRLQPELVLEAAGEIAHTSFAVRARVRHFPDMIEHMARGEKEDGEQGDGCPEVAVLNDGEDVGGSNAEEGDDTEAERGDDGDFDIVDRADERRRAGVGELAGEPGVDGFGAVGTGRSD